MYIIMRTARSERVSRTCLGKGSDEKPLSQAAVCNYCTPFISTKTHTPCNNVWYSGCRQDFNRVTSSNRIERLGNKASAVRIERLWEHRGKDLGPDWKVLGPLSVLRVLAVVHPPYATHWFPCFTTSFIC